MRITLITVGKIKEKFYQDAISEYAKRLSRYCKLDVIQVTDEKHAGWSQRGPGDQDQKKRKGKRILENIKDGSFVIILPSTGPCWIRWSWRERSKNGGISGVSRWCSSSAAPWVCQRRCSRADYKLSFSKMTFPHQLMRVILLEQIYRSYRIIQGEPYP